MLAKPENTLTVASIDMDGCFLSEKKRTSESESEYFTRMATKSSKLMACVRNANVILLGSNRQSKEDDDSNTSYNNSASAFPAMSYIQRQCSKETQLDTFLMSDIYGKYPAGTAWSQATNSKSLGSDSIWDFDEYKISLIYAQVHRIATLHPDKDITFNFYDDRRDILGQINHFFSDYPDLLPHNIRLNLIHHGNDDVISGSPQGWGFFNHTQKRHAIQGTSYIDSDYQNSTPYLLPKTSKLTLDTFPKEAFFQKRKSPQALYQPYALNETYTLPKAASATNITERSPWHEKALQTLITLGLKAEQLRRQKHYQDAEVIRCFAINMQRVIKQHLYSLPKTTKQARMEFLQSQCLRLYKIAQPALTRHRGALGIANWAVGILTLGIGYTLGCAIKSAIQGKWSFSLFGRTQTACQVDKTRELIAAV